MTTDKASKSILVVDDTENWRELLTAILEDDGYRVTTASTFPDAMDLLQNKQFDLVTLDMRLVDESHYNIQGMELLKEVKTLQPSAKAIVLTGYPDQTQKQKAIEFYGADGYYEKVPDGKPFDLDNFSNLVSRLLQNQIRRSYL